MNMQAMSSQMHLKDCIAAGEVYWDRLTQSFEIASMARYGNCRNLPLGSINHIDLSPKKITVFFSIFQIQEFSKMMWSNLYSFRNGGCSSRKNVITQSWWTNTETLRVACNTNSEFYFLENTYGSLRERKIFVWSLQSCYASQTVKLFRKFLIQPPQAFVMQIMLNTYDSRAW